MSHLSARTRDAVLGAVLLGGLRGDGEGTECVAMMDMKRTTSDGRWTVTIQSNLPAETVVTVQDSAQSLKQLSDVLSMAARLSLEAAVKVLELAKEREALR